MKNITIMIICAAFNIILMIFGCAPAFSQVVLNDLTEVNELRNGDAENGLSPWTLRYDDVGPNPLAVSVQTHNEPTKNYGKKYFRLRTPDNAAADMYLEQVFKLNTAYKNQECTLHYSYLSNPSYQNRFIVRVLDQSGTTISSRATSTTLSGLWQQNKLEFLCGNNNTLTVSISAACADFCDSTGDFDDLFIDNINLTVRENNPTKFYYKSWILPTNPPAAYQFLFDTAANFAQVTSGVIGLQTDFVTSKIMCADGSTGTFDDPFGVNTCTGNETLGIAVLIPRPGRYEVCTKFNYYTNNVADEGVFGLYENVSGVLGSERIYLKAAVSAVGISQAEVCETYNYNAVNITYPTQRQWILHGRRIGASAGNGIEVYMNTTSDYDSYMIWTIKEL